MARWLVLVPLLAGCLGSPTEQAPGAIAGGWETEDEPAVGLIRTPAGRCTATLVGPRVLLTAAHCINADTPGGAIEFFTGPRAESFGACGVEVAYGGTRPARTGLGEEIDTSIGHDILAIALDRDPRLPDGSPIGPLPQRTPAPWPAWTPPLARSVITMIGYGARAESDRKSAGVKRMALGVITDDSPPMVVVSGIGGGEAICAGDSGGPLLLSGGAGSIVAGVASMGDCEGLLYSSTNFADHVGRTEPTSIYTSLDLAPELVGRMSAVAPRSDSAGPVLSIGCSGARPRCEDLRASELACRTDSDCAAVPADPCCGEPLIAVAAKAVRDVQDAIGACRRADAQCEECALPAVRPVCRANRCELSL